jgi:hypothetical protein
MAHILQFRSAALRTEPEYEAARTGGAQIIIFPGVRIERHVEPQDVQVRPRKRERGRPRRDRLELPD